MIRLIKITLKENTLPHAVIKGQLIVDVIEELGRNNLK